MSIVLIRKDQLWGISTGEASLDGARSLIADEKKFRNVRKWLDSSKSPQKMIFSLRYQSRAADSKRNPPMLAASTWQQKMFEQKIASSDQDD
jgi:hypothetical protein